MSKGNQPRPADDWMNDPTLREWARRVLDDAAPKIRDSALTISLVPRGEPDIKFAVELGLSIMFDKPLMLVVQPGTQLPEHLVRVADEIIEGSVDDNATRARIQEALQRMLGEPPA